MRILIGVATFPAEPGLYPQTQTSIDQLDHGDHTVEVRFYGGDDPKVAIYDNLTAKHNQMREDVLAGDYDALLTIEADMVIPPDALVKLAEVERDVVYGTYCSRHNPMILTFPKINGYRGRSIGADPEMWRGKFGTVIPSEGVGFGCTLIRRPVLEQVEFRRDKSTRMRSQFADDWSFAVDVKEAGFRSASHLGVLCGHIQPDGVIRWPDATASDFVRLEGQPHPVENPLSVKGFYRCRRPLFGPTRTWAKGETVELEADAAGILLSRGAIEML